MRVAVITPLHETRLDWLRQCHASVRAQTHACTHILVSDGGANPLGNFQGQHIRLSRSHADYGDTPRAVGSVSAIGQQFDALTYLDADDWYEPRHLETLVDLHRSSGAAVCTMSRKLYTPDGELLGPCIEADGRTFVGTTSLFFTRAAFGLVHLWTLMPADFHAYDDYWMWQHVLRSGLSRAHSEAGTVAYRTTWPAHYRRFGREPPPEAKSWEFSVQNLERRKAIDAWFRERGRTG